MVANTGSYAKRRLNDVEAFGFSYAETRSTRFGYAETYYVRFQAAFGRLFVFINKLPVVHDAVKAAGEQIA